MGVAKHIAMRLRTPKSPPPPIFDPRPVNLYLGRYLKKNTEYFAGKQPLRMSQISRKFDDLTIAFWQGSCVFTTCSNNLGFADFIVGN